MYRSAIIGEILHEGIGVFHLYHGVVQSGLHTYLTRLVLLYGCRRRTVVVRFVEAFILERAVRERHVVRAHGNGIFTRVVVADVGPRLQVRSRLAHDDEFATVQLRFDGNAVDERLPVSVVSSQTASGHFGIELQRGELYLAPFAVRSVQARLAAARRKSYGSCGQGPQINLFEVHF